MRRVGALMPYAANDPHMQIRNAAFLQGMQRLGWTVGDNIQITRHRSKGQMRSSISIATSSRGRWWGSPCRCDAGREPTSCADAAGWHSCRRAISALRSSSPRASWSPPIRSERRPNCVRLRSATLYGADAVSAAPELVRQAIPNARGRHAHDHHEEEPPATVRGCSSIPGRGKSVLDFVKTCR
jgi:hypothetical protein